MLITLSGFIVLTSVDVLTGLFAVYDLHTNRYNNSMMLLTTQCTAAATINSKTSNNSMHVHKLASYRHAIRLLNEIDGYI